MTLPDGISMRSNRLQAIHKYAYAQEEEFYEKLFRAKGIDSSRAASSDRPESAVAPYVEESPRESEERISAPLPGGEACQEQRAERTQPAVLPSAAVQAVAARFAAALWRHRRFLLLAAAACTVLFLISSGLFEKRVQTRRGTGMRQRKRSRRSFWIQRILAGWHSACHWKRFGQS